MSGKFKVGQRVAAYINGQRDCGMLEKQNANGTFEFMADKYSSRRTVHPKQCRRLVPKKRREIWIAYLHNGTACGSKIYFSKEECEAEYSRNFNFNRAVKFREVLEK